MINFIFFIGIDVSKSHIDVSYYWMGHAIYLGVYENTVIGFQKFVAELSNLSKISIFEWFVCFENTGPYSKELLHYLLKQHIPCREENPLMISKSMGMRRGKSDKVDSQDICTYAYEKRDKINSTVLDDLDVIKLKTLLSRRDLYVKQRTALSASLKEQKKAMDADLYEDLDQDNKKMISYYNEHIKGLESKIKTLMKSNSEMLKNNELLTTIIGIGMVTAAYLISTTNNFKKITNARKYACFCGVAPFPNQSGIKNGRKKVNSMANKKLKSVFSNCVAAAVIHDPQLSAYYHRKLKEGKHYGVVANAIKNKLIQRAFAVIDRQTPYVKFLSYV